MIEREKERENESQFVLSTNSPYVIFHKPKEIFVIDFNKS